LWAAPRKAASSSEQAEISDRRATSDDVCKQRVGMESVIAGTPARVTCIAEASVPPTCVTA